MRVCKEWGSLMLNENVQVVCEDQGATECAFVMRAFYRGKAVDQLQMHLLGGGGFSKTSPLLPDGMEGSAGFSNGAPFSPGEMEIGAGCSAELSPSSPSHGNPGGLLAMESDKTYRIVTVCFDHEGNELAPVGILPVYDTGCPFPVFGIVKLAVTNVRVDMSPYGQSVFAGAVDVV